MKRFVWFAVLSALFSVPAAAQTLDINFSSTADSINGQQGAYSGDGVASPAWNNVLASPASGLVYSNGSAATGITVSFTDDGVHNEAAMPNLLSWYFLASSDTKTVTLTGLVPNGNYQLFLYGQNGGYAYRGTVFSITQGSGAPAAGGGNSTTGFGTGSFALGVNYVVFNATADSTGTLVISYTANPEDAPAGQYSGPNTYGIFNGLQITYAPASAGSIPFFQGFETNSNGVNAAKCGGTVPATLTAYAYGSCTPLGGVNAPNASFGSEFAITTPDNSQWGCAMNSYFGSTPDPSNNDFVAQPGAPYQGTFTQSIALYIPVSGTGAWAPPANPANAAFELNEDPNVLTNGGPNYSLESNILFSVPSAGEVQISTSGDANNTLSTAPFATITQSGWYTVAVTYMRAGNGTTDPPVEVISAYNSAGNLLGAVAIPCGGYMPSGCGSYSSGLLGSDQLDLAYFQPGFAPNGVAIDNVQTYLGFPNASTAPVVSNSGTYTATHGQPFSLQIAASNSPTSYQAVQAQAVGTSGQPELPAGLSFNPATGMISGTPTAAGTYLLVLTALNGTGVGTALLTLTVN